MPNDDDRPFKATHLKHTMVAHMMTPGVVQVPGDVSVSEAALLLDEPSMGLSPIMVDKIFEVVADIHSRGTTILLVEQNASRALGLANRGYVMESGLITMDGDAKALLNDPKVRAAYLGE